MNTYTEPVGSSTFKKVKKHCSLGRTVLNKDKLNVMHTCKAIGYFQIDFRMFIT